MLPDKVMEMGQVRVCFLLPCCEEMVLRGDEGPSRAGNSDLAPLVVRVATSHTRRGCRDSGQNEVIAELVC